jgi:Bacterial Ig-like domain (group 2)
MTDIKVPASGNIRVWWALPNAFTDYKVPTAAEINASLDISDAISWNDFDFNLETSNQIDDPAITAIGKVIDRGYTNFGGSLSLYYPGGFDDATSTYSLAYDALDAPRTLGYVVMRMDGAESSDQAANGDLVHVFKVMTDGYAESITGEEAFRYTVTMLPQGDFAVRTVVGGGNVTGVDATLALNAGNVGVLVGLWGGRNYTNGLEWTSSDTAKATVRAGVVTAVAAGSATITATAPNGQTDTCAVTVS